MATYDGSGAKRSAKNDPTAGGRSFRDQQKDKQAGKKSSAPSAKLRPTVKQCRICNSTHRDAMERLIVYGMSQAEVIRHMENVGEKYSAVSMSNHMRKHMTLGEQAMRRLIEKQAEKSFENIEEVADTLLSNRAMLEVMRQKAFNSIADDSVSIEPETALRIIDKLEADDAKLHQARIDEMVMEMNILTRTMKQIVPESMWTTIADQFRLNLELERTKRKQLIAGQ